MHSFLDGLFQIILIFTCGCLAYIPNNTLQLSRCVVYYIFHFALKGLNNTILNKVWNAYMCLLLKLLQVQEIYQITCVTCDGWYHSGLMCIERKYKTEVNDSRLTQRELSEHKSAHKKQQYYHKCRIILLYYIKKTSHKN